MPTSSWWRRLPAHRCCPPWWWRSTETGRLLRQLIRRSSPCQKDHGEEPFVTDIDDSTRRKGIGSILWSTRKRPPCTGSPPSRSSNPAHRLVSGDTPATVHLPAERQPLMINTILPRQSAPGGAVEPGSREKRHPGPWFPWPNWSRPCASPSSSPSTTKTWSGWCIVTGEMAGRPRAKRCWT
jgi:hypothetical protein